MHKGHYGHYSGNSKFSKRHDEDYDAKEAYNKNLTASARLHYLENDRHDHESPAKNIVGAVGKAASMAAGLAGEAKQGAEIYKLASAREAMKKAIGEAGQKLLKGSNAIGQKREELSDKDKRKLRRQARRKARKTKGDTEDIYYNLVSDKMEENKNK